MPFAGGSASDVVTRIMLDRMAKTLGQPFIVDNRPGAGGNTGTQAAARTAPDGYTLVMSTVGPLAANRTLFKSLGYDPEKDFSPISLFAILPNVVVINSKLPPKTLPELVAYAKQRPKELNYGSVGVGSSQHLAGAYFDQVAGVQLVHVPYRNIAQYTPDFIAGQVPLGFQFLPNVLGMLSSGDARALAVTSPKRMTALPDVPTAREAGLALRDLWLARAARAGRNAEAGGRQAAQGARRGGERPDRAQPVHRAGRRAGVARPGGIAEVHRVRDREVEGDHRARPGSSRCRAAGSTHDHQTGC